MRTWPLPPTSICDLRRDPGDVIASKSDPERVVLARFDQGFANAPSPCLATTSRHERSQRAILALDPHIRYVAYGSGQSIELSQREGARR